MSPEISLVIPAYNEAKRLPSFLHSVRDYGQDVWQNGYEIIVVDDASRDGLAQYLSSCAARWPQLSVRHHAANRGKGAAVRTGMLAARGRWLLFADADGATPIEEEAKLRSVAQQGSDVVIGSRLFAVNGREARRCQFRGAAGRLFAESVRRLLALDVRDTQCGFKMFSRSAGRRLFGLCREEGYLLDVEVLVWAQKLGYRIVEVPVRWNEVPESKVRLFSDGWNMLSGLVRLRRTLLRTQCAQVI